jgi:RNA polymerase sigma-70 factor, ECF subfamily
VIPSAAPFLPATALRTRITDGVAFPEGSQRGSPKEVAANERGFEAEFRARFDELFALLFRLLDRLTGDAAVASDIAQESLIRLYERGAMPDDPRAWLVTVALNRFRKTERRERRRRLLLSLRALAVPAVETPALADAVAEEEGRRATVRAALDALPLRERSMLLLRAEGYSYREIGDALRVKETSVGALLSRAKSAFARAIRENPNAIE